MLTPFIFYYALLLAQAEDCVQVKFCSKEAQGEGTRHSEAGQGVSESGRRQGDVRSQPRPGGTGGGRQGAPRQAQPGGHPGHRHGAPRGEVQCCHK